MAKFGAEEASRLIKSLAEVAKTTTVILTHRPGFSHIAGGG